MARWNRPGWSDALGTAIDWYANANADRRVDFGVILSQVALERLSYEHCVSELGIEKNGARASDRLRTLARALGIPIAIPAAYESIMSARGAPGGSDWKDAAHAVTSIRNELAHTGSLSGAAQTARLVAAWQWATWVLEMTILALCGYRGSYWNRMTANTEKVPWATE